VNAGLTAFFRTNIVLLLDLVYSKCRYLGSEHYFSAFYQPRRFVVVVEVLLFAILFVISPLFGLLLLAAIAVAAAIYYAALLLLMVVSLPFVLPVVMIGAALIAAATFVSMLTVNFVESASTMMVGSGHFIGNIPTNFGHIYSSVVQSSSDILNSIGSFFSPQEVTPVVATPVRDDEVSNLPSVHAYVPRSEGNTLPDTTHRRGGLRLFDSIDSSPSAPPSIPSPNDAPYNLMTAP
jgi:hypothetical protein